MPDILTTNTDYTFGTGGTYTDMQAAIAQMQTSLLLPNVTGRLLAKSGHYNYTAGNVWYHPQGAQISIEAETPATSYTFVSLVSITSNGASDHDAIIQLNTTTGLTANADYKLTDYLNFRNVEGTGAFDVFAGPHKITNVDAGNNRVTIKLGAKQASIGTCNLTAAVIEKFNVTIAYTGVPASTPLLDVQSVIKTFKGILLIGAGGSVLNNGIIVRSGAGFTAEGTGSVTNCGRAGIWPHEGSFVNGTNFSVSDCGSYGINISTASFAGLRANISGCTRGITTNTGHGGFADSNIGGCSIAIEAGGNGHIIASGSFTGNYTAFKSTTGIIELAEANIGYNTNGLDCSDYGRIITSSGVEVHHCTTGSQVSTGGIILEKEGINYNNNTTNRASTFNALDSFGGGIVGSDYVPEYDIDAQAYMDEFTSAPSTAWAEALNTFFTALKADTTYSAFDGLFILTGQDSQSSLLNMIDPTKTAIAVNSPTFAQWEGFTGDASTSYIYYPYAFNTLTKFQQDDASIGVYSRTNTANANYYDCGTDAAVNTVRLNCKDSTSLVGNINSSGNMFVTQSDSLGLNVICRDGSASAKLYKNGSLVASDTDTSTTVNSGYPTVLKHRTSYSGRQIAIWLFGRCLTATENATLDNAVDALITAVDGF